MSIEFFICISGIMALFIVQWNERKNINKKMNAFFCAMEDIDRENREKLSAAIALIIDHLKDKE